MTIRLLAFVIPVLLSMPASALDKDPTPAAAVGRAVRSLQQEVKNDDPEPPRSKKDFFRSFEFETDGKEAAKRLEKRQSRDPRVDSYIRWQLTAIADPGELPDGRRFERLLEQLPALPKNPMCNELTIRKLEREGSRPVHTEKSGKAAMNTWNQLEQETESVKLWVKPGRELREWLIGSSPEDELKLLAMLELIHAEVKAGWDPGRSIRQMDQLCAELGNRQSLSEETIKSFGSRAMTLTRNKQPLIRGAWLQELDFNVEVTYVAIRDYDVNRWLKRLRFGSPLE